MNCYRCGGAMREQVKPIEGEYADKKYKVSTEAMVCQDCGYTTLHATQMDKFLTKVADEHRKQVHLLTSAEIRKLRAALKMSQEQFAEYLGVGLASVKRWELGQPQDKSNDELIRLRCTLKHAEQNVADVLFKKGGEPDKYSGGQPFSLSKLSSVILFFLHRAKEADENIGPLVVNKLCWYADADHFRRHGTSITGARYARLPYGPSLDEYRLIFGELQRRGVVEAKAVSILRPLQPEANQVFTDDELFSLRWIWNRFRDRLPKIVDESHQETAWKRTSHADLISFELVKG